MKNLIFMGLLLLSFSGTTFSQNELKDLIEEPTKLESFFGGIETGKTKGAEFVHLNLYLVAGLNNGKRFSTDAQVMMFPARNKPEVYYGGFIDVFGPTDGLASYSIQYGFASSFQDDIIQLSIEGGAALICFDLATFTPLQPSGGGFIIPEPTHTYEYQNLIGVGFSLKSRIEVDFSNFIGMSINFSGNLNKYKSFGSIGLGLYAGLVK